MHWLLEILYDWLCCLGTDQVTQWFKADYLTDKLTLLSRDWPSDWTIYCWLIDWLTYSIIWRLTNWLKDLWLFALSRDWLTDWKIYGWLIDWLSNSTVRGLTNWLSDLWLIELSGDWPTDWMIHGYLNCFGTGKLTEWCMANWTVQGTDWMIYG